MKYRTIFSNFAALAFGEFASKAFGFITMVYLARVLGAENFGFIGFVSTISAYVVLFCKFWRGTICNTYVGSDSIK